MQKMWTNDNYNPNFDEKISLDLNKIEPSVAGPKRPQDKIFVRDIPEVFKTIDNTPYDKSIKNNKLQSGDVVIAAITSCTNTSNPAVMVGAGLLAKNAAAKQNAYEAILVDNGIVTEATASNVWIVKDKKLITHPTNTDILKGVTRETVKKLIKGSKVKGHRGWEIFDVNDDINKLFSNQMMG